MAKNKDKAERVKEIVEQMQRKTPQKSKNPSLVQKEIKKELNKGEEPKKKEPKKKEEKKESGKEKGPGIPDGTGPYGDTSECQLKEKEKKEKVSSIVAKVKKVLQKS